MRGINGTGQTSYFSENNALLTGLRDAGTVTCSSTSTSSIKCGNDSLEFLAAGSAGNARVGHSNNLNCGVSNQGTSFCTES